MASFDSDLIDKINNVIEDIILHVENKLDSLKLEEIESKPLDNALFSDDIDSLLYLHVMQRMTRSFVTKLGLGMESIAKHILESSGATNIRWNRDAKPFDIKFNHINGDEYWIEMKSIFGQNKSNQETIDNEAEKATEAGKKFLLCVYNENREDNDGVLSGPEFWNFIGNDDDTWKNLSSLLNEVGSNFDFENWAMRAMSRLKVGLNQT
tara:strand:- start:189 stop:815 length:627 start_codon:yes stop_codon:yes gene_type:complete